MIAEAVAGAPTSSPRSTSSSEVLAAACIETKALLDTLT
jgi:hypothetical protein